MRLAVVLAACTACGDDRDPAADAAVPGDAEPDAPQLALPPDLALVPARMVNSVVITQDTFAETSCEVMERCVEPGTRRLLRFDTVTANLGAGDLVLGKPPAIGVSDDTFVWSTCHGHHHVENYSIYELRDATGVVVAGHKQAFCLQDLIQVVAGASTRRYRCTNQGISAGWADVYNRALPCQWIDVTGVQPGRYTLRVVINPLGALPDSDVTNNELLLDVTL